MWIERVISEWAFILMSGSCEKLTEGGVARKANVSKSKAKIERVGCWE